MDKLSQAELARIYANRFAPLPFVFGRVPPDTYDYYRVVKKLHGRLTGANREGRPRDPSLMD